MCHQCSKRMGDFPLKLKQAEVSHTSAMSASSVWWFSQVTNYRFRKSMGWEIKASLLYQAYVRRAQSL